MAYDHKPGAGSLFKNKDKTKENDRDYKGDGKLFDGTDVWLSGYINKTKAGETYLGITFKPKDEQRRVPGSTKTPIDINDEIPF